MVTMRPLVVGIFVGGQGTRMGGVAKGLLEHEGETLVARWTKICAACEAPAVLVGDHPAYRALGLPILADARVPGPLGGLLALLENARVPHVVAVACDMPFVSAALLTRLLDAPEAPIVAARSGVRWEPFFARYEVAAVLPHARALAASPRHALQPLFTGATELLLSPGERLQLRDWDTPADRGLTER